MSTITITRIELVRIVHADDCKVCTCCGEPFCREHNQHYADCACVGPSNAEEEGYELVERAGRDWGRKVVVG